MNKAVARLHARQSTMDAKIANAEKARNVAHKMPFEAWHQQFKLSKSEYDRMGGNAKIY